MDLNEVAPAGETLARIGTYLQQGLWPGVDMRVAIRPVKTDSDRTFWFSMLGMFATGTLFGEAFPQPPIWCGYVQAAEAACAVDALAHDRVANVGRLSFLPVPVTELQATLHPQSHLGHTGFNPSDFAVPDGWAFRFWKIMGHVDRQYFTSEAEALADYASKWTEVNVFDIYRYHLRRNLAQASGPSVEILLPTPEAVSITAVDDNTHVVHWHSRSDCLPDSLWAGVGQGMLDTREPRFRSWEPDASQLEGWNTWKLTIDSERLDDDRLWVGTDAVPAFTLRIEPFMLERHQQRREAWLTLQESQRPLHDVLHPSKKLRDQQGAQHLEVCIGNGLAAHGWQVMQWGVPKGIEGIDVLAFLESEDEAIALSVTLGNDLNKKLTSLLQMREDLGGLLTRWRTHWAIATTTKRENCGPNDLENCWKVSVAVLTAEDLEAINEDGFNNQLMARLDEPFRYQAGQQALVAADFLSGRFS